MSETIYYRFVVKRDAAAAFTAANTLLLQGEWALELDTGFMKMGDGVTAWNDLAYVLSGPLDLSGLADGYVLKWSAAGNCWIVAAESGGSGGSPSATFTASEALGAGNIVNIWDDAGTPKVRLADATAEGKEAHGFVLAAVASAASAIVYFSGLNTALAGLLPGQTLFLSTTPGAVTDTAPSSTGNIVQSLGEAYSTSAMSFAKQSPITLT